MSSETIYKLQPDRTLSLRGFDRRGAAAALHHASATGFQLSGVFRDFADFCVLTLWDADDQFGHYLAHKYLPDFDFSGMVLTFDVAASGVQPLDSPAYQWIPWRSLSYIRPDGSSGSIDLAAHITQVGGSLASATGVFTIATPGAVPGDRLTLWFQNIAFDYWPGLGGDTAAAVAANLATQINAYTWTGYATWLSASSSANVLTVTAHPAGADGNRVTMYAISAGTNLTCNTPVTFSGGTSAATWRVSIDFTALGIDQLRQAWLTIAPQLRPGAYSDTEWSVTVSNWTVTDPGGKRPLKIASPASSVRIGSKDAWVSYSGSSWIEEASNQPGVTGWFHRGFARRASSPGDSVTIQYSCQQIHDLYLGTSLYTDRGIATVSLDGDAATDLDGFILSAPNGPIVTRRKLRSSVAAGTHTVAITLTGRQHAAIASWDANSTGPYFYFDFIEAAVPGNVPDPAIIYGAVMPATDFDTDATYKLPPQRLVWQIAKLGFAGAMDHYLGVFWWAQRKRSGGAFPTWVLTFAGSWASGDTAFLTIGGTTIGKSVFPADTAATIAAHFAYFINETFIGVQATAAAGVLTVSCRTPVWTFTCTKSKSSSGGTIAESGSLNSGGVEGDWVIDETVSPVLNRAATDWHADFWREVHARGWSAVAAFSIELVNPPAAWAQRFADGTSVLTDTGFGGLQSTQCTFSSAVQQYLRQAYAEMAASMSAAGLTPWLQFGEVGWWFFPGANPSDTKGMAFYDPDTGAAALSALGRPLAAFTHPGDDPAVNGYADANFLRERIKTHIDAIRTYVLASVPGAKFELLWPLDVDYPSTTARAQLGGRLLRYVNFPIEYQAQSGSGLDRLKIEGLAFGATERNYDEARQAIAFPVTSPCAWPAAAIAYLVPLFNGGCPWPREYLAAVNAGVPRINLWAWDHLALLSWPVPLPVNRSRAVLS
jgi:hypothetical protein